MRRSKLTACAVAALGMAAAASAQTITGSSAALRTSGTAAGGAYTLTENGYVGTYITLAAPATIDLSVNASGFAVGGTAPRMNVVVNDHKTGWDVGSSASTYSTSLSLPAGTHFVRTELANSLVSSGRTLTVNNLSLSGGATFANSDTRTNALNAANTYIDHYRRGAASVALRGPSDIALLPGTLVDVNLTRHAFNFGTAVAGFNGSPSLSTNATYAARVNQHFNAVVPENAGKWGSNSSGTNPPAPGAVGNLSYVNTILTWAEQNNKRARMHNLIWGTQQPTWVNNMLANSGSHSALRGYISDRINYYVGNNNPGAAPANRYLEIDVYNESIHTTQYWNAYGAAGIADIYREVAEAAAGVGADNLRLYVNEYNVLQWSQGGDNYANWYRRHVEEINAAGQGDVVGGVGVQYYADTRSDAASAGQAHSVERMQKVFQNLSVTGLPITLTEFGIQSGTGQTTSQTTHANILEDTVRMLFGTPQANGFFMWGFFQGNGYMWNQATNAAFYDANWNPRQPLTRWNALMAEWSTNESAVINPDGTISFTGFFGDYSIAGQSDAMVHGKGESDYAVTLAAPPDWHFYAGAAVGSLADPSSWTNGVPNGIGKTAHFGPTANSPLILIETPTPLGMINFDNANSYTIVGAAPIVMTGPAGISAINVVAGSHEIAAPLLLDSDLLINIRPASSTLVVSGELFAPGRSIAKVGAGAVRFENVRAAALDVLDGTVRISAKPTAADPDGTSVVQQLSLGSSARLDITNNAFIMDYDAAETSPLALIRAQIIAARNGGTWDGDGITSSLADAGQFGIGSGESAALFTVFPTTFAGLEINDTSVLLRFTRYGDANLDGLVNLADFNRLASNFGSAGALWTDGDFNYDGAVNLADFNLLAANFGLAAAGPDVRPEDWAALASVVPEPASGILVGMGASAVLRRRRYRPPSRVRTEPAAPRPGG